MPERGDIVWLNFTPQTGHEQAGRRPAVVLSPLNYNHRAGLMICVPITNQVTGYPFEVQPTENKRQELPWLIRLKVSIGVLEKLREKIKLHQQNAPRLWEK